MYDRRFKSFDSISLVRLITDLKPGQWKLGYLFAQLIQDVEHHIGIKRKRILEPSNPLTLRIVQHVIIMLLSMLGIAA